MITLIIFRLFCSVTNLMYMSLFGLLMHMPPHNSTYPSKPFNATIIVNLITIKTDPSSFHMASFSIFHVFIHLNKTERLNELSKPLMSFEAFSSKPPSLPFFRPRLFLLPPILLISARQSLFAWQFLVKKILVVSLPTIIFKCLVAYVIQIFHWPHHINFPLVPCHVSSLDILHITKAIVVLILLLSVSSYHAMFYLMSMFFLLPLPYSTNTWFSWPMCDRCISCHHLCD